jgi:hypothetical protein
VTWWGALAGGFVAAVATAVLLELAQFAGLTRLDVPLVYGSAFVEQRDRARAVGYAIHIALGAGIAVVYAAVFAGVGRTGWGFGAALGVVQAGFFGTAFANVLLPVVHPRMGRPWTDSSSTPLLEPPGFLLLNYGAGTMAVATVLNIGYGAVVGGFAAGL